ncbi:hypothetical protein OG754_34830 [Streptomyces decoyicus]|uniref:hypothetical protein n=1 Tax=Streptomyces decoyicus TaxID=249567 RepID=UPI002E34B43F|nr:hypothetical protein [Streptomyces decoyicus]
MDRPHEAEPLHAMVRIPSVPGSAKALGDFPAERISALGYRTSIDGAGTVRGGVGGPDGPEILLLGRADTVPGGPPCNAPTASCAAGARPPPRVRRRP